MSRIVNMGISNALSGFVSQILSYNQDTARISLFCKQSSYCLHKYWYKFQLNVVYLACQCHFDKEMVIFYASLFCKQILYIVALLTILTSVSCL